ITPSAQGALTVSAGYGGDSVHGTSSGSTIVTVNPPSSNNYTISWQGFDWDGGGEETLTLNGQFLASLPAVDTPQNSNVYVALSPGTLEMGVLPPEAPSHTRMHLSGPSMSP